MEWKKLPHLLGELRTQAGLSRDEIATTIGISASYVSILENPNLDSPKIPSIDVLQKYVSCFVDEQPQLVFSILLAAAKFERNFTLPIGWLSSEADRQESRNFYEMWILSDVIAELKSKKLLVVTGDRIRAALTKYVFFIPPSSEEWEALHRRLKQTAGITDALIRDSVMCIETSLLLCLPRVAISFSQTEGVKGTVTIGHITQPEFYPLQDEQSSAFLKILDDVVQSFRANSETKSLTRANVLFKRIFP